MEGGFRELIGKMECAVTGEKRSRDYSSSEDQQASKDRVISLKDNRLELAKAEMWEVKEENQRLKKKLNQIMDDYNCLEKKFLDVVDQKGLVGRELTCNVTTPYQEREFVSLCLGRSELALSSDQKKNEKNPDKTNPKNKDEDDEEEDKEELRLGLDCKFEVSTSSMQQAESPITVVSSADNSAEEVICMEEKWPPRKALTKAKSNGDQDEAPQQTPAKRARVSVRVKCDTATMNDGCQWRKYGQKIARGNPCPRAYYRCTVSTTCPVRKQVQRCSQDMSILITTYEGTHNHPLSTSATAMASTTSAAASMLMSGSSISGTSITNNFSSKTIPAELHGLNFYLSDGSKSNAYYPQGPSIYPSPSCPTITLDLTSNSISSSSTSPFNIKTPSNFQPRSSTTNLNFSSWNNMSGGQPYIKNQIGLMNFGGHPQENLYQSYMQKYTLPTQQSLEVNTIEAATKAITSDPNFQSALQAALSSIINSSSVTEATGSGSGKRGAGDINFGQKSKLAEALFPVLSSFPTTSNANYTSKKSSLSTENLEFHPPPNLSSFSTSKSKSTSSEDSKDHVK